MYLLSEVPAFDWLEPRDGFSMVEVELLELCLELLLEEEATALESGVEETDVPVWWRLDEN